MTKAELRAEIALLKAEIARLRVALDDCEGTLPAHPGFNDGTLNGWNIAGVGDVIPTVVDNPDGDGRVARFRLTGSQDRSELILGGVGNNDTSRTEKFYENEGGEHNFAFKVIEMVYGGPGCHNLIMQFKSDGEGSPAFGLQLWDYQGKKGLWSHSTAMGGDRFLAPISHGRWHECSIDFIASRVGNGGYTILLDGIEIDSRTSVGMIRSDRTYAYIKQGLYRNGGARPGTSELLLDYG